MKLVVCAVFDSAVQAYGRPIFVAAAGAATRSFMDEVNRNAQDNPLFAHPDDFELRCLAVFDDESGVFVSDGITALARGKDVKNVSQ
jgi:hypothetical protein